MAARVFGRFPRWPRLEPRAGRGKRGPAAKLPSHPLLFLLLLFYLSSHGARGKERKTATAITKPWQCSAVPTAAGYLGPRLFNESLRRVGQPLLSYRRHVPRHDHDDPSSARFWQPSSSSILRRPMPSRRTNGGRDLQLHFISVAGRSLAPDPKHRACCLPSRHAWQSRPPVLRRRGSLGEDAAAASGNRPMTGRQWATTLVGRPASSTSKAC